MDGLNGVNLQMPINKPTIYIMCGISGAGKTTFAKKFAEENKLLYLNPDAFYAAFNGDECIHENKEEVWECLYKAIRTAGKNCKNTLLDTNCLTIEDRKQLLDWTPEFNHYLIFVEAPFSLCLSNNASRRRVIPEAEMYKFKDKLQKPSVNEDERWDGFAHIIKYTNETFSIENT